MAAWHMVRSDHGTNQSGYCCNLAARLYIVWHILLLQSEWLHVIWRD